MDGYKTLAFVPK